VLSPDCSAGCVHTAGVLDDAALLDNHLAFLAAHRGEVRRDAAGIEVVGEDPFFSCWIPLSADAGIPDGTSAVRLVPWSGEGWERRLTAAGFESAEVATKTAYRGRGLASTLLGQARRDAAGGRLTLQVVEGSAAERLYLKLGFRPVFRSPHFRRPA
jgi:GNAT superfamily N-acetyltransferase